MEPTAQALAGDAPGQILKRYLLATRPSFLPASVLPVVVGSSAGVAQSGSFDLVAMLLALVAIIGVHGGVNVLNDVCDDANGTDRHNDARVFPYTGGSRFIQNGVMTRAQMQSWAVLLLGASAACGALLLALKGWPVLWLGLAGMALGILYSVPPVFLAGRGLGETAVGVGFGLLPVCGSAWLQSGVVGWSEVLLAVPVSIWVANILLVNEVPDAVADAQAGKRTLAVRLGATGAAGVYAATSILAAAASGALVAAGGHAVWGLAGSLVLLAAGLAVAGRLGRGARNQNLEPVIQATLAIHAAGCLWLTVWVWLKPRPLRG